MRFPHESRMAMTIAGVRAMAKEKAAFAELHAQVEQCSKKEGSNGKPFWELKLRDATDNLTLRVWSDSPNVPVCEALTDADSVAVEGGVLSKRPVWNRCAALGAAEIVSRGARGAVCRKRGGAGQTEADFSYLLRTVSTIADPRLQALAQRFLEMSGPRFRRAAAAG